MLRETFGEISGSAIFTVTETFCSEAHPGIGSAFRWPKVQNSWFFESINLAKIFVFLFFFHFRLVLDFSPRDTNLRFFHFCLKHK